VRVVNSGKRTTFVALDECLSRYELIKDGRSEHACTAHGCSPVILFCPPVQLLDRNKPSPSLRLTAFNQNPVAGSPPLPLAGLDPEPTNTNILTSRLIREVGPEAELSHRDVSRQRATGSPAASNVSLGKSAIYPLSTISISATSTSGAGGESTRATSTPTSHIGPGAESFAS
jgi:hypothetical protein